MIRIYKHPIAPQSLDRKTSWKEDDVQRRLKEDQKSKCYVYERKVVTDFQVDHFRSRADYPDMTYEWRNLLWSCSYCNQKKSDLFDDILNPFENDIERLIFQKMDFPNSVATFHAAVSGIPEYDSTVKLLHRIYNGKGKMRNLREQQFYDYAKSRITAFQQMVISWMSGGSEEIRNAIVEELDIKAEFLGFKYWIIRSNPQLLSEFKNHIVWNKTPSEA